jgi:hypothetical protein
MGGKVLPHLERYEPEEEKVTEQRGTGDKLRDILRGAGILYLILVFLTSGVQAFL